MTITARHELRMFSRNGWHFAECTCNSWRSENTSHDQLLEDYQVHRDVIDEAERCEARLDNAVAHAGFLAGKEFA